MKLLIFCVFFIFFKESECFRGNSVDTFQFGNNEGSVAFTKSGKIGVLDKNVDVPIVLPYCMDLTYVRVDVDNPLSPPKVDFDPEMNTVRIKYRTLQYSKSSYTVTAKAQQSKSCNSRDSYY